MLKKKVTKQFDISLILNSLSFFQCLTLIHSHLINSLPPVIQVSHPWLLDIIEVNAASKELKVKSLKEAMVILEDVTEYLTQAYQKRRMTFQRFYLIFSPLG